jgi:integrase
MYWLRVLIPDDLRHLYPRTSKGALATDRYRKSLGTSNADEAKVRALALRAQFEAEFLEKRKGLHVTAQKPSEPLVALLAERIRHTILAGDDATRYGLPVPDAGLSLPMPSWVASEPLQRLRQRQELEAASLTSLRTATAAGALTPGLWAAQAECRALGLDIDWSGQEAHLLALTRTVVQATADAAKRSNGEPVETPKVPERPQEAPGAPQTTPGTPTPTYRVIRDLVPLWKSKTKPTAEAQGDMDRALRLLDQSGIPTELATLKGIHGATFRDWLRDTEARGISQQTASHRFGAIKTLLNRAVEYGANDKLTSNPWTGIRFPVEGSKRREPFRRDELRAIHQSEQFSIYTAPSGRKGADAVPYFMPLLGLFSGARVGELAQLEVADVRQHDDVWVLDIHEEAEGSTVKTENALRRIPVHPELIRLGFLDYVADLRKAGETKLFPSLHQPGTKKPSYLFGQAFRAYLDKVGVTRPLATFHAYRHGFRSALENAGVSTVRIHRLVGHADGSVDARYTHLDIAVMAEDVAKVQFAFLDLPRVYPTRNAT